MPMKMRIATKQIEKKLVQVAQKFQKNPSLVLPECRGSCRTCYFEKLKKDIEKLKDEKYVEKMAGKKGFVAAVAATIMLAKQKIPYVAFMKIGDENVYYAKRGKVKDEMLVGIQNWEKPNLRMLAYMDIARKKKVYLFSMPDTILCAEKVPEEFVAFLQKKFSCSAEEYILITWKGKKIPCCSEKNSLLNMKHYFYYPEFEHEIAVEAHVTTIECASQCDTCLIEDALNQKLDYQHYISGEMSDKKFLENYKKKIMWNIEKKKVLIASNKCYGNNADVFIERELQPKEWEREAVMEIIKNERKAIILEQPSAGKLLEKYGVDLQKLKEEYHESEKKTILKNLPTIRGDKLAEFIDDLARTHRVEGKEGVMKKLKGREMNVKEKAIAYAFLHTLGAKGEEWKYGKMEREFGKHLAPHVAQLLQAEGDEYGALLQKLVKEIG